MSLCSNAQRPMGTGSSARVECSRSEMVGRTVEELGFEGMKNTLWYLVWIETGTGEGGKGKGTL